MSDPLTDALADHEYQAREIAKLRAVVAIARKVANADTAALQELKDLGIASVADTTLVDELSEALTELDILTATDDR